MKVRILIIDDEPHWIDFVQQQFGAVEIVIARNEDEVAQRLKENQFTLIIASARWLQTLESMGENYADKYSDKTVVVTVRPSIDEALKAYNVGAVLYTPKSFNSKDFLTQMQEVLPGKE